MFGGELFPAETTRRVLTVSELTSQVKRQLEKEVGLVWVTGEATNLRAQSSGHIYFTLKDAASQLSCVLFRGESVANREILQDGQKLAVQGDLTVYEPRGQYQLIVRAVELQGGGHNPHRLQKIIHRNPSECPNVFEDFFCQKGLVLRCRLSRDELLRRKQLAVA